MDGGLWHCTGDRDQDHPYAKEMQKPKLLPEEALQIAVKRREAKSKGEKERYKHLNAEFQRTARRDKKAFLSDQCKEIEENNRMGKTRDLFKKIRVHVSCTEIRLIIFFAAKDGEALYSQQKQDQELTVAQIMNSLLPNSD